MTSKLCSRGSARASSRPSGADKRLDAAVLEQMNQLAQFVFIESERVRRVEPADPSAAQRAAALIVQRKAAQERRAALDAKVFRRQRLRLGQASAANRHARKILQRLIADPAIVGEEEGEKGSGDLSSTEGRQLTKVLRGSQLLLKTHPLKTTSLHDVVTPVHHQPDSMLRL